MADRKISDLTALTTPASGDYLPIVDISEAAAASKNKRITVEELMRGAPDGTAASPGIAFESDPNTGIYSPGADQLAVSTGGTGRLFVDSSGRLLIGTSSAVILAPLEVNGNGSFGNYQDNNFCSGLRLYKSKSGTTGTQGLVADNTQLGDIRFLGSDGSSFVQGAVIRAEVDGTPGTNDMPGRLVFSTAADGSASPTEAMRINNAGELLVGYTSDNGAYKLQVNSQIFATSATVATSDGRYKENVATLGGCLDLIKALRPVSFTWKPQEDITRFDNENNEVLVREGHNFPEGTQVGFIAQEVQEVLADKPWLSSVIKENVRPAVKDNEGNELAPEEQFFGIAEGNLIAVLTNALQEALQKIEDLETRIVALEG